MRNLGMHKSFWEYHQAFAHRMSAWRHEALFSWQWWLGIALSIIPWVIWLFLKKKDSSLRLFHAGILVALVAVTLDSIGVQLSLWNYLKPVTPVIPAYFPYDYALLPVIIMLLIQFLHKKNPWKVGLIFGILAAFVGEPIFQWTGIYFPVRWHHIYSLPIYMVIYYLAYKIALGKKYKELE